MWVCLTCTSVVPSIDDRLSKFPLKLLPLRTSVVPWFFAIDYRKKTTYRRFTPNHYDLLYSGCHQETGLLLELRFHACVRKRCVCEIA
jgi:hypothetical protein